MDLGAYFLIGLTTGGLTCLAVQGGLLATAMTRQVTVSVHTVKKSHRAKTLQEATITGIQLAKNPLPVIYFLAAKLLSYTLLGLLLGLLGSAAQITPTVQAIMQILAGLFMLATALNMLNSHPVFRYFVIQPPKAFTRLVRDQAKSQEVFAPATLGFLTVLIPCGTTQAMEVVAISSGNPLSGAAILFVFVLGTMPTFLVLGFLATRLRGKYQQLLALAAALLILFLGIVSLDGGLNLLGSPLAPSRLLASTLRFGDPTLSSTPIPAQIVGGTQELTVNAYPTQYSPSYLSAKSGQPIRLRLVTNNSYGCTRGFTIPTLGIQRLLPETGETVIDLPPQPKGNLSFTCSMGMYSGIIAIY
ncbi:MAG: sulfite exporter TauE/SafE family protein [Anaerolineae bacterium]|nr:sulfite exporter TauE/SafE family protein [Anaerolineae bacterium]